MKKYMMLIMVLVHFISCSKKSIETSKNENLNKKYVNTYNRLYDIWGLKKINDKNVNTARGIILEINTHKKTFLGNAGCNNISGDIVLFGKNKISFKNILGSQMACQDLNVEEKYLLNLRQVRFYKIENLHLLLFNSHNELLLDFIKID